MSCNNCVHHLKTALQSIDGVISAIVDLEGKSASIEHYDSVDSFTLIGVVNEEGYNATLKA
jgi:copper chaperone CopZ